MNFFIELKRLCKARDITLDQLMKRIGKPGIRTYTGWRQRDVLPRANDLYEICKVLEVSMEHFFGDDEGIVVNKTKIDFINKLNYLTDDEFESLYSLTETQLKSLANLAKSMQT